jgi:hypothetical protein
MNTIAEFLQSNSALLVAVLALLISLRANYTAHSAYKLNLKSKADSDKILLFEKKRALLNEVDRQNTRLRTLMLVAAQKILLFREHPSLHETMQEEFDRLKSNLKALQELADKYDEQRKGVEAINVGADIAVQEELLANIQRLTIHVEKDIAHEQGSLAELRAKLAGSNAA